MIFYDFEVFKHNWMVVLKDTTTKMTTEIVDDVGLLRYFYENHKDDIWIGYNTRHYDQWILKGILCEFNPYDISKHIIEKKEGGWNYSSLLHKVQLYNYDVMTTPQSLKQLEGFMGNNIEETSVPFNIDRLLTGSEINEVLKYCNHDVEQTMEVFINRIEEFESHMNLILAFKLPLKYVNKTKAQLSAIILDAHMKKRNDEFDITIPDTIKLDKYKFIDNWYRNTLNLNYDKSLEVEVAGVPHVFAWGGIHGAIPNYIGEGIFLNVDVASYYPSLMIEYGFGSRSISNPTKYQDIYNTRLKLKAEKNPMQQPYKIVLNSTYGAMKDKYNNLYDPLQANNVCVAGQLMLLDLIEKLEGHCQLIQSNTDGILVKLANKKDINIITNICREWENRTKMKLEYDFYSKVIQKDVNNYIIVDSEGKYKSKGAYVKKLNSLDYDLPIVNRAVAEYLINGTTPEESITMCRYLKDFQKVVKIGSSYEYIQYNGQTISERIVRVFASRLETDGGVFKMKTRESVRTINSRPDVGKVRRTWEKIANTPEKCFIDNGDINNKRVPRKLDRQWYIDMAYKRINDFKGV